MIKKLIKKDHNKIDILGWYALLIGIGGGIDYIFFMDGVHPFIGLVLGYVMASAVNRLFFKGDEI
jgi:hypothetical protein